MDFKKFDERSRADAGVWLELLNPETLEPLVNEDGSIPRALVRGSASRAVQQSLHDRAQNEAKNKSEKQSLEGAHRKLIEAAKPLVLDFKNITLNDKPVTVKDCETLFDLTFPRMDAVTDDNGSVLKYEMKNKPFAVQIIEASTSHDRYLGNE